MTHELTLAEQLDALFITNKTVIEQTILSEQRDTSLPADDEQVHVVRAIWAEMFAMMVGTDLETDVESIAWDLVNIWHRAAERRSKELDRLSDDIREALDEQDGSEIASLRLEELTARAEAATTARDAFEAMREEAAGLYMAETGSSWRPAAGVGRMNHKLTSAAVNGRAFLAAKRKTDLDAATPKGTPILFTGGRLAFQTTDQAATFADNLTRTLNRVFAQVPDMVLVHGGDTKGIDRLAASWAERNKVPQVVFGLDMRLGNRAGFARNKQMLATRPKAVIAFQGNGVCERLVADAMARRLQIIDRRGPLGTRPSARAGQGVASAQAA